MNTAYLQYWEESERGWGTRPDGCSLHLTMDDLHKYVSNVYSIRTGDVPHEYDRTIGSPIEVKVSNELYKILIEDTNARLFEYELGNLLRMREIQTEQC